MAVLVGIVLLLLVGIAGALAFAQIRLDRGIQAAERAWREHEPPALRDFGSTHSLSILPLVVFQRRVSLLMSPQKSWT